MKRTQIYQLLMVGVILAASLPLAAQDSIDRDYSEELKRVPPTEPADALKTFEVAAGYRLELVASEPLVTSPVAASFDEDGRLYVVEMRDYSEQDKEKLGRVRRLEDTNGDGQFDKSTIFAEGLSWPTAIICYDGGVFVGAAPDIFYLKDTNGDGVAEERRVDFTGFGRGNVQGLLNSFCWGLDNRIHVAVSSAGANLQPVDSQEKPIGKPVALRGRDFAFDPRDPKSYVITSGGGQHGMCFDDWGRKFVCSNSDHIQLIMLEDADLARNPYIVFPNPRISIAADGPQADVFRISPVEPWREIRTRLRTKGIVPGIIEGGGRAAGYFTGATGITIYRGNAWPKEDRGLAIVGDVGGNLVHRKRLSPKGLELIAERIDQKSEFVASRDTWFRPVQFLNAPDGTLYILDMYREVIEHPASLPPVIKKHLDLTSGRDRGRIYRIVPDGFKQPPLPQMSKANSAELVALLEHENGWHRDTAARLLYERKEADAVELLSQMATNGKSPLGRMHALHALSGYGDLDTYTLAAAIEDLDDRVRVHGLQLTRARAMESTQLVKKVLAAGDDRNLQVRFAACLALGHLNSPQALEVALRRIREDTADRWIRAAIGSSFPRASTELLTGIWLDPELSKKAEIEPWMEDLIFATSYVYVNQAELFANLGEQLVKQDPAALERFVRSLGNRGPRASMLKFEGALKSSEARKILASIITQAQSEALDAKLPIEQRQRATTLLLLSGERAYGLLINLLTAAQPVEVQATALEGALLTNPLDAGKLIARLDRVSPTIRQQAISGLLGSDDLARQLLTAAQKKQIELGQLTDEQRRILDRRPAPIRALAKDLVLAINRQRGEVVTAYQESLKLVGDAAQGSEYFKKQCSQCHKLGGVGHEIGPNLAAMKNKGAEAIMVNVLDPNREVNPQYMTYTVVTKEGRSFSGMISAETATSITLKKAENMEQTVLRIDIEEIKSTGQSLMPEGMEKQLTPQQLADVIAFLLKQE